MRVSVREVHATKTISTKIYYIGDIILGPIAKAAAAAITVFYDSV